ncbi:hypothetical protein J4573_26035 [Actinomadura barringtoniae]|uniref:Uncharacterized protein n=1 Tax=Actinomadura barringtoniae TaxID=1427535 RepID=A0A939PK06_9ACTN|nr:hypothetical protein [Actinomadura barringtoniae]MBO2450589.1 hypothetical protein [Actinomadura barringtoniae]
MTHQARMALFFVFAGASVLLFLFVILFGLDKDKASAQRANQVLEYGGIASAILGAGVIAGGGSKPDRQGQFQVPQPQPQYQAAAQPYPPQQQQVGQSGPYPQPQAQYQQPHQGQQPQPGQQQGQQPPQ